jgi:ABC-type bacteriocin/lantibiotic exporter with double-glycine peptidase domain
MKAASSVRGIMSRAEVLYADKVQVEVENIKNYSREKLSLDIKAGRYKYFSDNVLTAFSIMLPFVTVLVFIGVNGNIGVQQVVVLSGFIYFASRLSNYMWNFLWFIKTSLDRYPQIQKLWSFLDDIPTLSGYEDGKKFVHSGGEIELRNISFSYEK